VVDALSVPLVPLSVVPFDGVVLVKFSKIPDNSFSSDKKQIIKIQLLNATK